MSAVTATHKQVAALARRHGAAVASALDVGFDAEDVSRRVEQYHRTGGYREVRVVALDRTFLLELWAAMLPDLASDLRNVRVTPSISAMHAAHGGWMLDVSIWKAEAPEVADLAAGEAIRPAPSTDPDAARTPDDRPVVWWLTEADVFRLNLLARAGLDVDWPGGVGDACSALDWRERRSRIIDGTAAGNAGQPEQEAWPRWTRILAEDCAGIALDRAAVPRVANLGGIVTGWDGNVLVLAEA